MDDVVNRLARELAEAIGSAVAEDPRVEACREKARAAGCGDSRPRRHGGSAARYHGQRPPFPAVAPDRR